MALIESAESSNRIEGVTVDRERLKPLVIGHARPRDRSEEEVAGYRRALDWIHKKHGNLEQTCRFYRHSIDQSKYPPLYQVTSHVRELRIQGYRLQRPMAASLSDGIYELRPGRLRILYGYDEGVAILLHVFRKKTREVPHEDIDLALKRLKEWRQL